MADCPRKKAADNRKRQEKDRRERQSQDRVRERLRSTGEQEGEQRRPRDQNSGNTGAQGPRYGLKQIKEKIKSLEKWKRKKGKLSEEDQRLLQDLTSKANDLGEKEKKKKEKQADAVQKELFEAAVKEAGMNITYVEKEENVPKMMEDVAKKKKRTKKILKKDMVEENVPTTHKHEKEELPEGVFKPTVEESLINNKARKEMKKQSSMPTMKPKKKIKGKDGQSKTGSIVVNNVMVHAMEQNTDTIKQWRKKQAKNEKEKEKAQEKEPGVDRSEDFDYNMVERVNVEAGTLDYFAPLPVKTKEKPEVYTDPKAKVDSEMKAEAKTEMKTKQEKSKKKTRKHKSYDATSNIKCDMELLKIAQNFSLIKMCQEAETKSKCQK